MFYIIRGCTSTAYTTQVCTTFNLVVVVVVTTVEGLR